MGGGVETNRSQFGQRTELSDAGDKAMNEQQTKQPAVGAGINDLNSGTWYQSACSGLWYRNHRAAGTVSRIAIDGVRWTVAGEAAESHKTRGTNEEGVRCSEWIDELGAAITTVNNAYNRAVKRKDAHDVGDARMAENALRRLRISERCRSSIE